MALISYRLNGKQTALPIAHYLRLIINLLRLGRQLQIRFSVIFASVLNPLITGVSQPANCARKLPLIHSNLTFDI